MLPQNERIQNAEKVLPKGLLRRLQRYCCGLVYIPRRRTQAQSHRDQVRILHSQGLAPAEIARKTTLSAKHIRRIIRQLNDGITPDSTARHKIYESVPEDIVEMIQRYVEGPVYIPPSKSQVARRYARVKRLLREGHTTAEVASLTGMSERRNLSFSMKSVQQFIQRFTNDIDTIRAAGFDIKVNEEAHRVKTYDISRLYQ